MRPRSDADHGAKGTARPDELQSELLTEFVVVVRARIKKALAMLYRSGSSSAGTAPADAGGTSIDELMHTIAGEAAPSAILSAQRR